jgi:hypothetical protein
LISDRLCHGAGRKGRLGQFVRCERHADDRWPSARASP